jgi:hypothetical protein
MSSLSAFWKPPSIRPNEEKTISGCARFRGRVRARRRHSLKYETISMMMDNVRDQAFVDRRIELVEGMVETARGRKVLGLTLVT